MHDRPEPMMVSIGDRIPKETRDRLMVLAAANSFAENINRNLSAVTTGFHKMAETAKKASSAFNKMTSAIRSMDVVTKDA